jgi:hypothetical protein
MEIHRMIIVFLPFDKPRRKRRRRRRRSVLFTKRLQATSNNMACIIARDMF